MITFQNSLLVAALILHTCHGDIVYTSPPPFGGNCWSSTMQLNFWELGLLIAGDQDLSEKRIYNLCSDSLIEIGVQDPPGGNNFVGGDQPLVFINPNVNILCGETGESKNNCTLSGGNFQLVGNNPPGILPEGFLPDVSNLTVKGVTFTNFERNSSAAAQISVAGQNIVFSDCIWKDNNADDPSFSALQILYEPSNDTPNATTPFITATVEKSLFENNNVRAGVVSVVATNGTSNVDVIALGRVDLTIDDCTFRSNIVSFDQRPLSVVEYVLVNSTGKVDGSCFFNNTSSGAMISWVGDEETVTTDSNFGEGNTAAVTDDNGDQCEIVFYETFPFGNPTCVDFDSNVCVSNIFTDAPSASPTTPVPTMADTDPTTPPPSSPPPSSSCSFNIVMSLVVSTLTVVSFLAL